MGCSSRLVSITQGLRYSLNKQLTEDFLSQHQLQPSSGLIRCQTRKYKKGTEEVGFVLAPLAAPSPKIPTNLKVTTFILSVKVKTLIRGSGFNHNCSLQPRIRVQIKLISIQEFQCPM